MPMKRMEEIPTIDVVMVTIVTHHPTNPTEIALDTASKISVEPQIETTDAIKLIVKGVLKAQKGEVSTITGNKITLTDNVFGPELAVILQGGSVTLGNQQIPPEIVSYQPPVAGSAEKGEIFTMNVYSAQYDSSGQIVRYERITYPNCQGTPFAVSSEDNVFRVSEYIINSAPKQGEPPYTINYILPGELPNV